MNSLHTDDHMGVRQPDGCLVSAYVYAIDY